MKNTAKINASLLTFIPKGKENAISRNELSQITGYPDRFLRSEIKRLVRSGIPILSSSSAKGYWYSEDISEIDAYLAEARQRERTSRRTNAKLEALSKRIHKELDGQLSFQIGGDGDGG